MTSLKSPASRERENTPLLKRLTGWTAKYWLSAAALSALWLLAYSHVKEAAHRLVFEWGGASAESSVASAIEFFLYDGVKILLLLAALIYVVSWLRAALNVDKVRDFLVGRGRGAGYFLGALFGAVTPFCSCSSIPLFLGFTSARIPFGVTMAFLITSPVINEVAVVMLWGLLGWKFTVAYVFTGMTAGMVGGFFMDRIHGERWLQPFILETLSRLPPQAGAKTACAESDLTLRRRHLFAYSETTTIVRRVWRWVLFGVAVGAVLHGVVPDQWFSEHFGAGQWWTVPLSVLAAIPLYSHVTGIVPVMESLLVKGMPLGTTMAFCMSAVAASLPELILLKQIMTPKLQLVFIAYLWVVFTCVGWLLNALEPFLI